MKIEDLIFKLRIEEDHMKYAKKDVSVPEIKINVVKHGQSSKPKNNKPGKDPNWVQREESLRSQNSKGSASTVTSWVTNLLSAGCQRRRRITRQTWLLGSQKMYPRSISL